MNKSMIDYPTFEEKEHSIQYIKNHIQIQSKETSIKKRLFRPFYMTSFAFLTLVLCTILYFTGSFFKKVQPYHVAFMQQRALTTQYLPNIKKLAVDATKNVNVTNEYEVLDLNTVEKSITLDNFNELIDTIGFIDNPFDRNFSVSDVKNEVYYVVANVPYFNKWVHLDHDGKGDYYVSYNETTEHITIMRRSRFQPWVYDHETKKIVDNDDFIGTFPNHPIEEEAFYKIDYYFDEHGREVVEAEIVSFLEYFKQSNIIQYQYFKNIKDTSFTKYIITPIDSVRRSTQSGEWGYDIYSNNSLGSKRQFMQIDYVNPNDVSLLFINQGFSSAYNDAYNQTQVNFYRRLNNELFLYNTVYNYGDVEMNNDSFISNGYYKTVFDYYVNANNEFEYYNMAFIGTPDDHYQTRSSERIQYLNRELFYTNGNESLAILPSEYYLKHDNDHDVELNRISQIPLYLNVSLSQLANNAFTSVSEQEAILMHSPNEIDLYDQNKTYSYEHFIDYYLTKISENIVKKSYLATKFSTVSSRNILPVYVLGKEHKSDLGTYVKLKNVASHASIIDNKLELTVTASVDKNIFFELNGFYSIGLVAKGKDQVMILDKGTLIKYNNEKMNLQLALNYDLSQVRAFFEGEYEIGFAFLSHKDEHILICSEISLPEVAKIENLSNYNEVVMGYNYGYQYEYTGEQLKLMVSITDIEPPTLEMNGLINQTYRTYFGRIVSDLLRDLSFKDNDQVVSLVFQNSKGVIHNNSDYLIEDTYRIIVGDPTGNETSIEFVVDFIE